MDLEDECVIESRAGLRDIDVFLEFNNARYLTHMELARWEFAYRTGFLRLMREHKWGVAVGGASIRFRRRIPFLSRFTLTTRMLCHDERWFYFLQETHRGERICSSALMKIGITSKEGLVPATRVLELVGRPDWGVDVPAWVRAWIDAEGQRPWPSGNGA